MGVVAFIGLVCLAAVFAYGFIRNRARTRREKQLTEAATNAEYREDGRGP